MYILPPYFNVVFCLPIDQVYQLTNLNQCPVHYVTLYGKPRNIETLGTVRYYWKSRQRRWKILKLFGSAEREEEVKLNVMRASARTTGRVEQSVRRAVIVWFQVRRQAELKTVEVQRLL